MASAGALLAPLGRIASAEIPSARRRLLQVNGYPVDAETPLDVLTSYLTPNDLFFVRNHWVPLVPDAPTWKLTVDGEVARPQELTLTDLKQLPGTSVTGVLQCAGNGRGLFKPYIPGVQWQYGARRRDAEDFATRATLRPRIRPLEPEAGRAFTEHETVSRRIERRESTRK